MYHTGFEAIHKKITWEQIGYEKHIKPSIPHQIHHQILNYSEIKDIYHIINTESPMRLGEIANKCEKKLMKEYSSGEIVFSMK